MKKIFLTTLMLSAFTLPVSAVCSITGGACTFDSSPSYTEFNPNNQSNTQRYDFNKQNPNLQKIQNDFDGRYDSSPQTQDYDADCQFGICLPKKGIY